MDKINELDILRQLFHTVVITNEIAEEFGEDLPDWVNIRKVSNKHPDIFDLDRGESSALRLCMEIEHALIILDDNKARKTAKRLNVNYTGSLGVFLNAKQENLIPSFHFVLKKVQKTNFRFSDRVFNEILKLASESGV